MFDVLAVVDLRGGLAVRAGGGRRERYAPVEVVAGEPIPAGDATALVQAYRSRWGIDQIYVADLDAIARHGHQVEQLRAIAATGVTTWLDAGIASVDDALRALDQGAARLIVGLETLPSFAALESICQKTGSERVVFSLDLRSGQPVVASAEMLDQTAERLVSQAVDAGAASVIVLDLTRVGSNAGPDFDLLERVRTAGPKAALFAGGGVRDARDLVRLKNAGCQGALVASALLDGTLTSRDLLAVD